MYKDSQDLILAAYAMDLTSYIPYNCCNSEKEFEKGHISITSPNLGPEDIILAKNFYECLSPETKKILALLFNYPTDTVVHLTKGLFWALIQKNCTSPKIKRKVLKEIKNFYIYFIQINAQDHIKI